ncbi:MAG: hypothetical protein H7Z42_04585, partial [Roseiflexaceae bacterium]|nr:hypothetical protein [Roseiflexaceae bacterium]
ESQNQESGTAEPQNQESQNQESGTAEPQNQESQNPIARRFSAGDAQNPGSELSSAVAPSTQRSPFTVLLVDHTGDERAQAELLASLVSAGVVITRFAEQQSDLEDIFMQVTRGLVQ